MKKEAINIRDPFVLFEDGKYYLYGTRAKDFGCHVGGVDVYVSDDMVDWSEPIECFNSIKYELNRHVNWAPEVHEYRGSYYMFATFTQESGLKGTCVLKSDSLHHHCYRAYNRNRNYYFKNVLIELYFFRHR